MATASHHNHQRLLAIAAERGYTLTSDIARRNKVIDLMATNYEACGEWLCPCKQTTRPPQPGIDVLCPCPTLEAEIAANGSCHCRLFMS